MNREQTFNLLAQGKEAWRRWAEEMRRWRTELEATNEWIADSDGTAKNEETKRWKQQATLEFSTLTQPHTFDCAIDLSGCEFPGYALFDGATFKGDAWFAKCSFRTFTTFQRTIFQSQANFDDARFSGVHPSDVPNEEGANRIPGANFSRNVDFTRAKFIGRASFSKVIFDRTVWFNRAVFEDDVWFRQVRFSGDAPFQGSEFRRRAWFLEAKFNNEAWFKDTVFYGEVDFTVASFSGGAAFDRVQFIGNAVFRAAQCTGAFSFASSVFYRIPDFIQSHFSEAPHFDDIVLRRDTQDGTGLAPRYRALRRLAIQGQDHTSEREFFVGELKTLRGAVDRLGPNFLNYLKVVVPNAGGQSHYIWRWSTTKAGHGLTHPPIWPGGLSGSLRYWYGLWYQWLSDFGRSLILPPIWWLALTCAFAAVYLGTYFQRRNVGFTFLDTIGCVFATVASKLGLLSAVCSSACVVGQGDPFWAAIGLSLRRGLVFAGLETNDKVNQIYACLYGVYGAEAGSTLSRLGSIIPDDVFFMGFLQLVLSTLLIFLLLLAIRNHFRIG